MLEFLSDSNFVSKISKSHISYAHLLELKPQSQPRETLRNAEFDILSPQMSAKLFCISLCVCVWVLGLMGVQQQ